HPALPLVPEEACRFKHMKVPRRGLPCMRKDCRDLSSGHRASVEIDREQHATPSRMGQRTEDRLIRVRTHSRSRLKHQQCSGTHREPVANAIGCLGWYRPISPPPGRRIFAIEPHLASCTSDTPTPLSPSVTISAFKSSHMKNNSCFSTPSAG